MLYGLILCHKNATFQGHGQGHFGAVWLDNFDEVFELPSLQGVGQMIISGVFVGVFLMFTRAPLERYSPLYSILAPKQIPSGFFNNHGKWPIYRWFTYIKMEFSMAMLNNQMVIHLIPSWSHTRARAFFWEVRVSKNAQLAVCFSLKRASWPIS